MVIPDNDNDNDDDVGDDVDGGLKVADASYTRIIIITSRKCSVLQILSSVHVEHWRG